MKKIINLAMLFAAVMMSLTACGNKDEGGKEPKPDPEPEYESPITIDGDYADWGTVSPVYETVLPTEGTIAKTQIKKFKVFADDFFINFYLEFDKTDIFALDFLIDVDNDAATGQVDAWNAGADILLQGGVYNFAEDKKTQLDAAQWDPSGFSFGGENGTSEWTWTDLGMASFCSASAPKVIEGNIVAIECQLTREMIPVQFNDTIGIGVIMETRGWSSVGMLPGISEEDIADGKTVDMLKVNL